MTTTINHGSHNGRNASSHPVVAPKVPYGACVAALVIALGIASMWGINHVNDRYWANRQAMVEDPSLPFVAWDRAIAQAPDENQRKALTDAKHAVVYVFERPFLSLCTTPNCSFLTEWRNLWRFGHQPSSVLYQTLGGNVAYQQALAIVRQDAERDRDQQDAIVKALDTVGTGNGAQRPAPGPTHVPA